MYPPSSIFHNMDTYTHYAYHASRARMCVCLCTCPYVFACAHSQLHVCAPACTSCSHMCPYVCTHSHARVLIYYYINLPRRVGGSNTTCSHVLPTYLLVRTCLHVLTLVCMFAHPSAHLHACVCVCTCVSACMHVCSSAIIL